MLNPCVAATKATIAAGPIAIPRIVKVARSFLDRRALKAKASMSRISVAFTSYIRFLLRYALSPRKTPATVIEARPTRNMIRKVSKPAGVSLVICRAAC